MTEAARVLRIAQPSLSQQISSLERRVGAKLFHRRPKGMELTEGGRILYASARRALAEIESSLVQAREARSPVRVGVCGTVPEHLLARVERVLAEVGSLDVEFAEADSGQQLDLLRTGTLAFGVMRVFHDMDDLATLTLADEPLGVLLRPDHPLADHAALSWADLAGQELLWFPTKRNPRFTEGVLAHLAGHGWSPRLRTPDAHSRALYRHHLRNSQNLITLRARSAVRRIPGWPGDRSCPTRRANASSWSLSATAPGRSCWLARAAGHPMTAASVDPVRARRASRAPSRRRCRAQPDRPSSAGRRRRIARPRRPASGRRPRAPEALGNGPRRMRRARSPSGTGLTGGARNDRQFVPRAAGGGVAAGRHSRAQTAEPRSSRR